MQIRLCLLMLQQLCLNSEMLSYYMQAESRAEVRHVHLSGADGRVAQSRKERLAGKCGYDCWRRLLVIPVHHIAHRCCPELFRCMSSMNVRHERPRVS